MRTKSRSPDIFIPDLSEGTAASWVKQSMNVMNETVRKTVTTLIWNCFIFLRRFWKQYWIDVARRADQVSS